MMILFGLNKVFEITEHSSKGATSVVELGGNVCEMVGYRSWNIDILM